MILNLLLLIVGFVALVKGADYFVDGSASLAKVFRVPSLIIGLTIVALGTSAPELAVSTTAALQGSNEIALSNVVGSNMFNLLVVLGACALFCTVPGNEDIFKRDFPFSIIVTVFVLICTLSSVVFSGNVFAHNMADEAGVIGRLEAVVLIVAFVGYILWLIKAAKKNKTEESDEKLMPVWKCFLFIVLGLVAIVAGGQAVVYSAKEIARFFGMSETLIGLTVVAFGTSLPELVTSVVAARKNETGLAVGNVIGSNIFNLMLILGVSSFLHPVTVNFASFFDLIVLIFMSVITYVFLVSKKELNRPEGIIMILIYAAQIVFAVVR
ncbi:calcium/sodium antiporter [Butyrivibrio sp. YAB3001]|uniref:calcium/sodium antiporter n=1 Tax=Butyrivibrio sp. YAB3001 TaxID=1520812 RepID=UPI0008F67ED4|nr:calcium/sodium antiporter [Butyrivibrio sp. YAB3001]SFC37034.1 cation:H+ antiporter [Butyrivibrio sp. YAB3001]